ncbi:class I SAM-dependent methyltransferase [Fictibacillus barbaricus]|uniref:Ubiquinone/menaquinone biosynthesis C-methylase UbiE n=1 Tax=Fictibacillus barbaricus TaxID=182136 RepID=A0ABU1TX32_9BACL|nr:class I SAM-dependent methyltransferase [Fictibacillus barbaricus]MDR7071760.1 ubiquinone/menaquinone biosynthesis C-methylase UbiE [Fictibacillus barbaricus]
MSFSNYGELCTEVYDLTKKVGQSFSGDIEYYAERLKATKGRILEAMVGSGRVIIPLLEAGLKVDGIDYSSEMLASCQKRLDEKGYAAKLFQGELQNLQLPQKYDAIIIPGGSFLLIEKREESIAALKQMYENLENGGRLILDIFLPTDHFEAGKVLRTLTVECPNGDIITMEDKLVEVNFFEQYKVSYLKYEKWRKGNLIQTELQRFAIRWYSIHELKLIMKSIGFKQVNVCADFQYGNEPAHASQSFVFEATK